MPLDERVLVIPESHFRAVGYFEGFRTADGVYAEALLDPRQYSFLARHDCESDPTFKQLIPYIVLTCGDLVFQYRRGAKGTETRLQSLRSIGIGGHISEADAAGDGDPYLLGLERELAEEVRTGPIISRAMIGFIYDPRTPVGSVHLGIVHRFELERPETSSREDALIEAGFASRAELLGVRNEFETWSQFSLEALEK